MSRRVIVDCDTGIDDALALLYLAAQEDIEIVAAGSVHGNVAADLAAVNALRVLELAGLADVPVAVGAGRPLAQPLATAEVVHGRDGLGNTFRPPPAGSPMAGSAAEQLARLAREQPGEFEVLALGPLTNLALALMLEPRLAQLIPRVVIMGGATHGPGNITPTAEANIWHDPEAAALVLGAPWPVTLVPLDVTQETLLTEPGLARLHRSDAPAARFSWQIVQHYLDFHVSLLGRRECPMHDPLAAILLAHPELADYENAAVCVELGGTSRGATIVDRRPGADPAGSVAIATRVDRPAAVARLLEALDPRDALLSPGRTTGQ